MDENLKKYLEILRPGLWAQGGRRRAENKKEGLTSLEWIKQVLIILGGNSESAKNLREIVANHYRGNIDPALRRWSGAHTHHAEIEKDVRNLEKNGMPKNSKKNCPLLASLKAFYKSAQANNTGRCRYKIRFGEDDDLTSDEGDISKEKDEEESYSEDSNSD